MFIACTIVSEMTLWQTCRVFVIYEIILNPLISPESNIVKIFQYFILLNRVISLDFSCGKILHSYIHRITYIAL